MCLLFSLFLSLPLFSGEMPEIDQQIQKEFLTIMKDAEVEKKLDSSAEFNECRQKYDEYKQDKDKAIKFSVDCFKKRLSQSSKNDQALKKLSDDLQLVEFGVIKSNSVSEITNYLGNKMIKSLTGKDPNEKDPEKIRQQLDFKNQKMVDHKVFIDLHKNMLIKSALMEVSRFCFEKLRLTTPPPNAQDLSSHWGTYWAQGFPRVDPVSKQYPKGIPDISQINDLGVPTFFNAGNNVDLTKKDEVYKSMISGFGNNLNPLILGQYFEFCKDSIFFLCEDFKNKNKTAIDDKSVNTSGTIQKGAAACLSMEKIRSIREAVAQTKKIEESLKNEGDAKISLEIGAKFYGNGNNPGEESIDKLSNLSSEDMLSTISSDKDLQDQLKKCQQRPTDKDCEKYIKKEEHLDKSLFALEREMNFKREVERERIKEIQKDSKKLKEYLAANGYMDLLKRYENNDAINWDEEIVKIYESKKIATIQTLKEKVGRRQVTDNEYKALEQSGGLQTRVAENMKESLEEKSRLAQLVLFNNIITSQLEVTEKSSKKKFRNVSGWLKEQSVLEGLNQASYNPALFSDIKDMADKEASPNNTSLEDDGILDVILGKEQSN